MKSLKYIFLLPAMIFALGLGIQSCGDNTDFSKAHILTDDEMAELARQQRVRDSLRNVISADTIVITEVNLIASASSYDGVSVPLDFHAAAEVFGLTDQEIVQAIQNLWGSDDEFYQAGYPEVTAFAIEGTTHDDNFGAQTQAGGFFGWGHWWNSKGDVCEWNYTNNDEAVYTSIYGNPEELVVTCDIGQYPGQLYDGEKIRIIEALKYADENEVTYRVAYVFDITVGELGEVEGDVIETIEVAGNIEYNGSYMTTDIPVDIQHVVSVLGAPSWEDLQWLAINADGSYWQEMDAGDARDNGGFWFGQDGYKGAYGNDASVYMTFPTDEYVEAFAAAPMPGVFLEGSVVTVHCAATYGGKIVEFNVNITVGAAAELADNVIYTAKYNVTQAFRDDYSTSLLPIEANAVAQALGVADLNEASVVAYDANGKLTKDGTANAGFYFNADGSIGTWGENSVMFIEYYGGDNVDDGYNTLAIGMHPALLEREYTAGTVVPVKIGLWANDKLALFEINWKLGDEDDGFVAPTPVEGNLVYEASYNITQVFRDDYSSSLLPIDADAIMSKLGVSSLENAQLVSVTADGSLTKETTGNNGYWIGLDGAPTGWGNGIMFIEYHPDSDPTSVESTSLCIGMHPGLYENGYTDGTVVPAKFAFMSGDNIAMLSINWQIGSSDEGFVEGTDYASMIEAATNVKEIAVSIDAPLNNDYTGGYYEFDLSEVAGALGLSQLTLDNVMTFGVSANGSVVYQNGNPDYWFGTTGDIVDWGEESKVFIGYYGFDEEFPEDEYTLYAGLMPEACEVGDVYNVVYGLYANDKKVTFNITVTVTEPEAAARKAAKFKGTRNKYQPYYMNLKKIAHKNR